MMTTAAVDLEKQLAEKIAEFYGDMESYVRYAFPWGEKGGPLEDHDGPDIWQLDQMHSIAKHIHDDPLKILRDATASGRGIGKTAQVAWIILWLMSTRTHISGVVTANTWTQLKTKTWRELAVWHKRAINKHWFKWSETRFSHVNHPDTWYFYPIPNSEHNSQSFAGQHERHAVTIYDEACHDDKTDVLTDYGWMRFADLTGDERLLTMNPSTGLTFYEHPTRLYRKEYTGKMICGAKRSGSFCVTPNHKMLHQSYCWRQASRRSKWKLTEIQHFSKGTQYIPRNISEIVVQEVDTFLLPSLLTYRKEYQSQLLDMDRWIEFLGWYFSEGNLGKQRYADGSFLAHTVVISQRPGNNLDNIREIMCALQLSTRESQNQSGVVQIRAYNPGMARWLQQWGDTAITKHLPGFIRMLSRRQIRLFLGSFIKGDGYWRDDKRAIIYTSSPRMAEDLQELVLLAGYQSSLTTRGLVGKLINFGTHFARSTSEGYVISCVDSNKNITISRGSGHLKEIDYNGMVYCAEVPSHHTLFTRHNGNCMWSGNSEIPDSIWLVTNFIKDPRFMWFVFGNPTQNTGSFKECFGRLRGRWKTRNVDSRDCKIPDKDEMQAEVDEYGEDSDRVRIHIRGEFPRLGDAQFISSEVVAKAIKRTVTVPFGTPKIMGVDVARFGPDQTVFARRHGRKLEPLLKFRGLNTMEVAARIIEEKRKNNIDVIMIDGVGLGAGVVDRCRQLGHEVIEVLSGIAPDSENKDVVYNKRAEMWYRMRDWLDTADIPDDAELDADLTGIRNTFDTKHRIQMEKKSDMKKRGLASPDCFIGETLVTTGAGHTRIDEIKIGSWVETPFGRRMVIAVHTDEVPINTLTWKTFSNGSTLTGKGKHRIFTWDKGFIRLDAISLVNAIETDDIWSILKWRLASLLNTQGRSNGFKALVDTTSQGTKMMRKDFFIEEFGPITSGQYRLDTMFTTLIQTGATISSRIWNWWKALSTSGNTSLSGIRTRNMQSPTEQCWIKPEKRLMPGTNLPKVWHGIKFMGKRLGKAGSRLTQSALCVIQGIKHTFQPEAAFVPGHANNVRDICTTKQQREYANDAVMDLPTTSIKLKSAVADPVLANCEQNHQVKVYNLTLDQDNVYYANGILVENCGDALALTFSYNTPPVRRGGGSTDPEPAGDY